jgi:hypothetical protein
MSRWKADGHFPLAVLEAPVCASYESQRFKARIFLPESEKQHA